MAELHDLAPNTGSHRNRKRIGRGNASGRGGTSTRGHKGQKARSGGNIHPRREGGQMPLIRRIPKRGFKPLSRTTYQVVNVRDLERVEGDVSPEALAAAGLVRSSTEPVKILGQGELSRAVAVSAHAFSRSARAKIEAAGGTVTVVEGAPGAG